MRSRSLLVVLWLFGTVVAATIAWQSLRFVSASTDREQALLSPQTTGSVDGQVDSATSTGGQTTPPTSPGSATSAHQQATSTTTPTTAPVASSMTTTSMVATTQTTASEQFEQTFELIGGRTAIRLSATEIIVLWMAPADDYVASSRPEDGGIQVRFTNGERSSTLEAWWADGPRFSKEEGEEDD